jgi:hypothetical protein
MFHLRRTQYRLFQVCRHGQASGCGQHAESHHAPLASATKSHRHWRRSLGERSLLTHQIVGCPRYHAGPVENSWACIPLAGDEAAATAGSASAGFETES